MFGSTARRSRLGGLPTVAFALGGLLVAHAVTYLIAVPDPYHRDLLLQRAGHGYLPTLVQVALVGLVAGVIALLGRAVRREPSARRSLLATAGLLAVVQTVAFVSQEVLERVAANAPLADLSHGHLLLIGVAAQVVVAFAGAMLLRGLGRAAERATDLATARPDIPPRPVVALASTTPLLPRTPLRRRAGARGPPAA